MAIRVLLVDDHTIFREGVRALLSEHDDIEVVGEASDGREAIDKVAELQPDVVLMDIAMPGLGGLEATLEIRKLRPESRVLVLTQYDNREYVFPILKAGATGYVLKQAAATDLVAAIRAVHAGGSFLYSTVAKTVLDDYLARGRVPEDPYETLSDREKQVLRLVAEGRTSREIAQLLVLSVKTVMGHRANLMEKLGIHNRTELVKYAIRHGLVEVAD
jgi:DNA-binding NarL/FixJ family response regulator